MRWIKRVFSQWHRYVLWTLISMIVWSWIFVSFVADTTRAKKVSLYHSNDVAGLDTELAVELERAMPEGLRMVRVHPFSYVSFNIGKPEDAELYILSETEIAESIPDLSPLPPRGEGDYLVDGAVYGWRIYDDATGQGTATAFLSYRPGQNYYLCASKEAIHLSDWTETGDSAGIPIALHLIALP